MLVAQVRSLRDARNSALVGFAQPHLSLPLPARATRQTPFRRTRRDLHVTSAAQAPLAQRLLPAAASLPRCKRLRQFPQASAPAPLPRALLPVSRILRDTPGILPRLLNAAPQVARFRARLWISHHVRQPLRRLREVLRCRSAAVRASLGIHGQSSGRRCSAAVILRERGDRRISLRVLFIGCGTGREILRAKGARRRSGLRYACRRRPAQNDTGSTADGCLVFHLQNLLIRQRKQVRRRTIYRRCRCDL